MRQECRERFPRHRLQREPPISDPCMHHGACVTHVPWCMSGSLSDFYQWTLPSRYCLHRIFIHFINCFPLSISAAVWVNNMYIIWIWYICLVIAYFKPFYRFGGRSSLSNEVTMTVLYCNFTTSWNGVFVVFFLRSYFPWSDNTVTGVKFSWYPSLCIWCGQLASSWANLLW